VGVEAMKAMLKRLLPTAVFNALKQGRQRWYASALGQLWLGVQLQILHGFAAFGWSSALYYLLFSRAFDREHRGVLRGRVRHLQELRQLQRSRYQLRRNTHRLEKGLLMRPARPVFGLAYIADTVNNYQQLVAVSAADDMLLQWASDVLRRYFSQVQHPAVAVARAAFITPRSDVTGQRVPYQRDLSTRPVNYADLQQLAWQRRSVRWFLPKTVPRTALDQAFDVANLAPSACNRQPFEFRVFDDVAQAQQLLSLAGGTAGDGDNVPVAVAIVGHLNAFFSERDRHLIYVDAGLAAMNFCLALETLELASCCVNWPDVPERERAIADFLQLPPEQRVVMLLAVGYPDPQGLVAYSQKKSLDEYRHYQPHNPSQPQLKNGVDK